MYNNDYTRVPVYCILVGSHLNNVPYSLDELFFVAWILAFHSLDVKGKVACASTASVQGWVQLCNCN